MMFNDRFRKKLKKAIRKGGLVIAPRRSGKTYALLEFLYEDNNSILVVCYPSEVIRLEKDYYTLYGILSGGRILNDTQATKINLSTKKILVDEYLANDYEGSFFVGVSSFEKPLKILKPSFLDYENPNSIDFIFSKEGKYGR